MKTLVLKLAGPLQSWGTNSHFETRHTDFYPSKSGIIGLISAGLGYRRDETEKIAKLNELNMIVRLDQAGVLLRDYHIAQKYKPTGVLDRNYVTNRYYISDAIYMVFISHENSEFLETIETALKAPYFQLFMGRRSNPVNADFFFGSSKEEILECAKNLEWQASDWYKKRHKEIKSLTIYGDAHLLNTNNRSLRKDRVMSFDQKHRKFDYRFESRMEVAIDNPTAQNEHDAFAALGGD